MSRVTQIIVEHRNADPTALTALGCLQRHLGFSSRLASVERRMLWELVGPDETGTDDCVDRLRRSGAIWNPNKERASLRRSGESYGATGLPTSKEDPWSVFLAWNPDRDLDRCPQTFIPHYRMGWRLACGILWALRWTEGDPDVWSRWSREAVVCSGPDRGLLVHPHLQDFQRIDSSLEPPWLPLGPAGTTEGEKGK